MARTIGRPRSRCTRRTSRTPAMTAPTSPKPTRAVIRGPTSCSHPRSAPTTARRVVCPANGRTRPVGCPDPAAERSRAPMWDVVRFAEQMHYDGDRRGERGRGHQVGAVAGVVAGDGIARLPGTCPVAQLDAPRRAAVPGPDLRRVAPRRLTADLELELDALCRRCDQTRARPPGVEARPSVGRYRRQWRGDVSCAVRTASRATSPAASIIDWALRAPGSVTVPVPLALSDPGPRSSPACSVTGGRRSRRLVPAMCTNAPPATGPGQSTSRSRRSRPPPPSALATPPGVPVPNRPRRPHDRPPHRGPLPTVCASDDRMSLVVPLRANGRR